jgi:hypothetical protein
MADGVGQPRRRSSIQREDVEMLSVFAIHDFSTPSIKEHSIHR